METQFKEWVTYVNCWLNHTIITDWLCMSVTASSCHITVYIPGRCMPSPVQLLTNSKVYNSEE